MAAYKLARVPSTGERITYENGVLAVPSHPIIPFVEGDGTGADIWRASVRVFDAAIEKAFGDERRVAWMEVFAGEKAFTRYGDWLPQETVDAMAEFRVSIKGPLTTPVGGGIRSLNVTLRQVLDLYACIRPVRWFEGVGAPVKDPGKVDVVIFRENTEDVYAGIEWKAGSAEANKLREFIGRELKKEIRENSAIGIKPMSEFGSKRLVDMALEYTVKNKRSSLTLVHKGNIMKFTEGAFRDWGYALAKRDFGGVEIDGGPWQKLPQGIVIKDAIADITLQQVLTRPTDFDVIATLNLNGDYLSDALAAQVGGIGIAPGGNINYVTGHAIFEATHGTAPKYAGQDKVNPGSLLLSGVLMLEHLGWQEAGDDVVRALEATIADRIVTYDFARLTEGATEVSTSAFAAAIVERL